MKQNSEFARQGKFRFGLQGKPARQPIHAVTDFFTIRAKQVSLRTHVADPPFREFGLQGKPPRQPIHAVTDFFTIKAKQVSLRIHVAGPPFREFERVRGMLLSARSRRHG